MAITDCTATVKSNKVLKINSQELSCSYFGTKKCDSTEKAQHHHDKYKNRPKDDKAFSLKP